MTGATDPFSASIIPFEVPEQMRAFAEKGVSQARESYAKFKDAAETHNGTVEAVFTSANKGASEYTAKLVEFMKANTSSQLDFAQQLFGLKSPAEALELWTGHTRHPARDLPVPGQGAGRARPARRRRDRRADQGLCLEVLQARRLIRPAGLN
ncbi:phasin [Bradyrhizobium japonicum]